MHHGYFWRGEDARVIGPKRKRLKLLLAHDINLFAYHLPLDMHPELGNNAQLASGWAWMRRRVSAKTIWAGWARRMPQCHRRRAGARDRGSGWAARRCVIGDPAQAAGPDRLVHRRCAELCWPMPSRPAPTPI